MSKTSEREPAPEPEPAPARVVDEERFQRPPFARDYPRDSALDRLVEYFARGNHRKVREQADALAVEHDREGGNPAIAAAARELRARLEPDRLAYVLLGSTLLLLLTLMAWSMRRSHDQPHPPPHPQPVRTVQTVK